MLPSSRWLVLADVNLQAIGIILSLVAISKSASLIENETQHPGVATRDGAHHAGPKPVQGVSVLTKAVCLAVYGLKEGTHGLVSRCWLLTQIPLSHSPFPYEARPDSATIYFPHR